MTSNPTCDKGFHHTGLAKYRRRLVLHVCLQSLPSKIELPALCIDHGARVRTDLLDQLGQSRVHRPTRARTCYPASWQRSQESTCAGLKSGILMDGKRCIVSPKWMFMSNEVPNVCIHEPCIYAGWLCLSQFVTHQEFQTLLSANRFPCSLKSAAGHAQQILHNSTVICTWTCS